MTARYELANRARDEPNSKLVALNLCRNADAHAALHSQYPDGSMPEIRKGLLAFFAEIA
jgi:hypothetical protein